MEVDGLQVATAAEVLCTCLLMLKQLLRSAASCLHDMQDKQLYLPLNTSTFGCKHD